jgi:hypothetical protein
MAYASVGHHLVLPFKNCQLGVKKAVLPPLTPKAG